MDSTDILLKAAEDVTQGMWCKGAMFRHEGEDQGVTLLPGFDLDVDEALRMKRCALGSIAVATVQLGGGNNDYVEACQRVANHLDIDVDPFDLPALADNGEAVIAFYNDTQLPDDPFDAGARLSDVFRRAAATV